MLGMHPRPSNSKQRCHKKLAFDFCKLDETDLNDDLLQAKRKKPYPVARARIVMGEPSPASQALEDQDGSSIGENKLDE